MTRRGRAAGASPSFERWGRWPPRRLLRLASLAPALVALLLGWGCSGVAPPASETVAAPPVVVATPPVATAAPSTAAQEAFLDELQERTFHFFWDLADPHTGLTPDRWPTKAFASVSATGFGLTAYPIGVERGWITREQARARVLHTLRFLWSAPQGPAATGVAGYRGFFYHFLVPETGMRFEQVELSTIDTTFLLAGALFCGEYFDRDDAEEREIRELAEKLYTRAEWDWAQPNAPAPTREGGRQRGSRVVMGWHPEKGFIDYDWRGYNEGMLVYLLALGSPTHPVAPAAWEAWTSTYQWGTFQGREHLLFPPLFGHQYSHLWVDYRGIRDAFMRGKGIDYFENSRRATLAQRAWAIENPRRWLDLGADIWGVTACDGPADVELPFAGEVRRFATYAGRGVGPEPRAEDGTLAPTAAGGSVPFAPEVAIPALMAMRAKYGDNLYGKYGFIDAFNPSFRFDVPVHHGKVVPGIGWFDTDYLGIDQGPILEMIENHRTGLVWRLMKRNPHLRRGLERAGFTGGWLEKLVASESAATGSPFVTAGSAATKQVSASRHRGRFIWTYRVLAVTWWR